MFSNKYIVTLLLGAVALAMFMVVFVHTGKTPDQARDNSVVVTEQVDGARQVVGQGPDQTAGQKSDLAQTESITETPAKAEAIEMEEDIAAIVTADSDRTAVGKTQEKPTTLAAVLQEATGQGEAELAGSAAKPQVLPPSGMKNTADKPATSQAGKATTTAPATGKTTTPTVEQKPASTPATATAAAKEPEPAKEVRNHPAPTAKTGSGNITGLSLHFMDKAMLLRIDADSVMPIKWFVLDNPTRIVVDLPGQWKGLKVPEIPSNQLIKGVRLGRQGNADRIVLDASRPVKNVHLDRMSDSKVELVFE